MPKRWVVWEPKMYKTEKEAEERSKELFQKTGIPFAYMKLRFKKPKKSRG